MDLEQLFAFADVHQPPQYALPVRLQPFLPDLVSAHRMRLSCAFQAHMQLTFHRCSPHRCPPWVRPAPSQRRHDPTASPTSLG